MELSEGEGAFFAGLALPDDGGLVFAVAGRVAVDAILRDIDCPTVEPAGERGFPLQDGFPLAAPSELGCFLGPEFLRILDRCGVQAFVVRHALEARFFAEFARGFDDSLFDEVGFDVLAHGNDRGEAECAERLRRLTTEKAPVAAGYFR